MAQSWASLEIRGLNRLNSVFAAALANVGQCIADTRGIPAAEWRAVILPAESATCGSQITDCLENSSASFQWRADQGRVFGCTLGMVWRRTSLRLIDSVGATLHPDDPLLAHVSGNVRAAGNFHDEAE